MRLTLLLLLAACATEHIDRTEHVDRGEALSACDVARPAYGNSLAACLVVLERWTASDALTANDWHRQEAALDTAHNVHALRAYLASSRQTLSVLLHVDSGWIERRLRWDSTLVSEFDSMEHAVDRQVAAESRAEAARTRHREACYARGLADTTTLVWREHRLIEHCDSLNP
jgi:hypothetical protein